MAEELSSAYGMQRVVCNRSSCFMRRESCPSSSPRGICFPIKIQFSPSHKQCWFFLMIAAASLTWRGRASPLSCCNSGSIKLQWNLCPWSQPTDPGRAACFARLWGRKHAHCRAGHPRPRLSPALKLGLHRYVTLFSCFELSLLAGRRGLGNKAGILSLPSALKQQAWKLAQFISDLCQALLIENNSSWIEGSSCYINSGEGGETNVFAGGERHTGSRLVLKLLLARDFSLLYAESQRWESFFCLDITVWMLLLLGPGSTAAISLALCKYGHVSEVTLPLLLGMWAWDLPAKMTTWTSLYGLQGILSDAATDFLPILLLHSRNFFDLNTE